MHYPMQLFLDSWIRGGGHMMDMGRGFGFFPGGLLFGLLPLLALLVLVIWAIRAWSTNRQTPVTAGGGSAWSTASSVAAPSTRPSATVSSTAVGEQPLDVLQMRYAKGEISRAEYDTIREDILRDRQVDTSAVATSTTVAMPTDEPVAGSEVPAMTASEPSTNDDAKTVDG
ncbi:MAG: SHOCT domain-containing protein [Caldilineaceae bacterium]|nr:SHOCT domain-containing protein [Caldilineaceae bacterium]